MNIHEALIMVKGHEGLDCTEYDDGDIVVTRKSRDASGNKRNTAVHVSAALALFQEGKVARGWKRPGA